MIFAGQCVNYWPTAAVVIVFLLVVAFGFWVLSK